MNALQVEGIGAKGASQDAEGQKRKGEAVEGGHVLPGAIDQRQDDARGQKRQAVDDEVAPLGHGLCRQDGEAGRGHGADQAPDQAAQGQPFTLELVGLCTDICVVSNALMLKANFPEMPICVDSACCAGVTPETHRTALETMRCCQIEVI